MPASQETKRMSDDQLLRVGHNIAADLVGGGLSAIVMPYFPPAIIGAVVFGGDAIRNLVIFIKNVNRGTRPSWPSGPSSA